MKNVQYCFNLNRTLFFPSSPPSHHVLCNSLGLYRYIASQLAAIMYFVLLVAVCITAGEWRVKFNPFLLPQILCYLSSKVKFSSFRWSLQCSVRRVSDISINSMLYSSKCKMKQICSRPNSNTDLKVDVTSCKYLKVCLATWSITR